jgi:hypothetical protein
LAGRLKGIGEIVARTDGVPLFVEELTRMLLESGHLACISDTGAPEQGTPFYGLDELFVVLAHLGEELLVRQDPASEFFALTITMTFIALVSVAWGYFVRTTWVAWSVEACSVHL